MSVRIRISVETDEADINVTRAPMIYRGDETSEMVVARELAQAVRDVAKFYGIEVEL